MAAIIIGAGMPPGAHTAARTDEAAATTAPKEGAGNETDAKLSRALREFYEKEQYALERWGACCFPQCACPQRARAVPKQRGAVRAHPCLGGVWQGPSRAGGRPLVKTVCVAICTAAGCDGARG